MSADNGVVITKTKKGYKITYYQGDGTIDKFKCKTLEEAVKKANEIDEEYQLEYGIKFNI